MVVENIAVVTADTTQAEVENPIKVARIKITKLVIDTGAIRNKNLKAKHRRSISWDTSTSLLIIKNSF